MRISEIIVKLLRAQRKYGDLEVFGSWEGQTDKAVNVAVSLSPDGIKPQRLLIDCDDCSYGCAEEI